jgi:hypothetical protein
MIIKLISFYSPNLKLSARRFKKQAAKIGFFDEIELYSGANLEAELYELYGDNFDPNTRGWGYWCWEPFILLKEFESLDEGDILIYSDIGCHINEAGRDILKNTYTTHIQDNGALLFQSDKSQDGKFAFWPEWQWTKPDLIKKIYPIEDVNAINSGQIVSTVYGFEVNSSNRNIVSELFDLYVHHFDLMNDSLSKMKPPSGFKENRHIQSGLSLLAKKNNLDTRSLFEIELPDPNDYRTTDWESLKCYPFNARRDLQFDIKTRIKRFVSRIIKYFRLNR